MGLASPRNILKIVLADRTAVESISIRVGMVAGQNITVGNHLFGDVGVHVKEIAIGKLGLCLRILESSSPLSIFELLGDHRAVKVQQQSIDVFAKVKYCRG